MELEEEPSELVAALVPESSPKWRKKIVGIAEWLLANKHPSDIAMLAAFAIVRMDESQESARSISRAYQQAMETMPAMVRKITARLGAEKKLANDKKGTQRAKAEARKLWNERHAGKHPRLRTNEQFATECMRRWPVLTSSAVITGWCTEWNKAAKARKS